MEQYDVLVVGGGNAGLCAALQASRILGAGRVCLVEKNGMCGGTTTAGGVNFPGIFHAWGKQVIGGIGWELIEQVWRECGKPLPEHLLTKDTSMVSHTMFQIRIDTMVYACLADEWLVKAGTVLKYHTMVGSVQKQDSNWQYESQHHSETLDDFRTHGDECHHIKLKMDRMAKELLVEEYPLSENHITTVDENHWLYEADVHKIEGAGRFAIGLYPHIIILEGKELNDYIKHLAEKILNV